MCSFTLQIGKVSVKNTISPFFTQKTSKFPLGYWWLTEIYRFQMRQSSCFISKVCFKCHRALSTMLSHFHHLNYLWIIQNNVWLFSKTKFSLHSPVNGHFGCFHMVASVKTGNPANCNSTDELGEHHDKWNNVSRSVVSDSLWPHGLSPARFLRPWNFPGKNTGVGCHFLLQTEISQTRKDIYYTFPLTEEPKTVLTSRQ